MTLVMMSWLVAIPMLGFMTGSRSMTPMAILCMFAYRHHLWLVGTWGFWAMDFRTMAVFGVLAAGELIFDKFPNIPDRTMLPALLTRIGFGGLVGALAATGLQGSVIEGVLLGAVSALVGTFVGFHLRHWLVHEKGLPAIAIALTEDVLVVGSSFLALGIITG
jgi:uncharacterized membrane protein